MYRMARRVDSAPRDGGDELTTGLAVLMPVVNLTFFGFIGATVKLVRAVGHVVARAHSHRSTRRYAQLPDASFHEPTAARRLAYQRCSWRDQCLSSRVPECGCSTCHQHRTPSLC